MRRDVRRERIAKGQCPNCGKEAAPYYTCHDCRTLEKVRRVLNRAERVGAFKAEKRGAAKYWSIGDGSKIDTLQWRADPKEGDRRLGPRLRNIRVDVEATLIEVIRRIGRPCSIEEIMEAWGGLRERRKAPLASDLACIIAAQDKRRRKAEKLSGGAFA